MNTLSRTITGSFFENETDFAGLKAAGSATVNSDARHLLRAGHFALYAILRGTDWRKGLRPLTNETRIAGGAILGGALRTALLTLVGREPDESLLWPFGGLVTAGTLEKIRPLLPLVSLDWSCMYPGEARFIAECRRCQDAVLAEAYPGAPVEAQEAGGRVRA